MSKLKKISQKVYKIRMDDTYLERLFAVQNDTASRTYLFKFTDTSDFVIDVSGLELEFTLQVGDKKQTATGTIVDAAEGLFEVTLTSSMLQIAGIASGQLMLIDNANNAKLQNLQFEIHIAPSLEFGGEGEEGQDLWFTFQMLRDAIETSETLESNYRTSLDEQEVLHAEVAEKHRETVTMHTELQTTLDKELERQSAETTRKNADLIRSANESTRKSAEAARQDAETDRQGKESARQSTEAGRVSAENTRKTNEDTRVANENERNTAETARASAESDRAGAEIDRADAESTRLTNEETRVTTQTQRDATWTAWQDLIEDGILPPATPTVAGAVKIDKEGADTAASIDTMNTELAKKVDVVADMGLSQHSFTTILRQKLDGIEIGANKYVHPSTHSLDVITETATKKIMTSAERTKLSEIAANANNYTHPSSHDASMITESATRRFVSDTEKNTWNAKIGSHGSLVVENIAVINAGESTANIPAGTLILELE